MTITNDQIKDIILKYALQNAVKYRKPPQAGAVMGKIMAEEPSLRPRARDVNKLVKEVLAEIEGMSPDSWDLELRRIAPELLEELREKKEPEKGLRDLEVDGIVVMRFAPNPNGPPTLGSARGIVVNSEYVRKYRGKFIIRFDDTDPLTKRPMLEAYDWYLEDCEWLDARPHEVIIASDRIPHYYEHAEKLISLDKAYVCFCQKEEFKKLKDAKMPCIHREQGVENNLDYWKDMISGIYQEHEAVLRIKTDIKHRDPAIRDWVAFRIIKTPHPRVGDKYVVWPMLDFESAIEDRLCGTTHIIRGKDLMDSEKRQKYIYSYFNWVYPRTLHWGRVSILEFGKFSTSALKRDIAEGKYSGWDDPRVPTLRALKRRGIQPQAIRKFMLDLGIGETDISLSLDTIYAENRRIVDPFAHRYFFVWDPVELKVEGAGPRVARAPLHPTENYGYREIKAGDRLYLCAEDAKELKVGDRLRLKDLYNIEIKSIEPPEARYISSDLELVKREKIPIIHWVPLDGIKVKVLSPEDTFVGFGEPGILGELGKIVQFERFGFVRIDSVDEEVVAYFAHK